MALIHKLCSTKCAQLDQAFFWTLFGRSKGARPSDTLSFLGSVFSFFQEFSSVFSKNVQFLEKVPKFYAKFVILTSKCPRKLSFVVFSRKNTPSSSVFLAKVTWVFFASSVFCPQFSVFSAQFFSQRPKKKPELYWHSFSAISTDDM